jgi:hypothetical protein
MSVFAETYVLKVDLPYSEYWLPLVIGMAVGVLALTAVKLVGARKGAVHEAKKPDEKPKEFDPFTEGSPSELRKSYRRQGNPTEVHLAEPEQKDKPFQGWVVDRSMGGLAIQVRDDIKIGTRLSVLPVNAPIITPWVDVEVRACRPIKEGYELGCQFIKTPAWSVLLLFE